MIGSLRRIGCLTLLLFASTGMMADEVDFDTQVIPILTRAGCNAGACHGAAAGRGGLQLSLYGSNPAHDHEQLVQRLSGRRVNLAEPDNSLLLLKPTGLVDHGGGVPIEDGSHDYQLLLSWITAGADRSGQRRLVNFQLDVQQTVFERPGDSTRLQALATFSDGRQQDVTRWTVFHPEDDTALLLSPQLPGERLQLTVGRRGQHVLLARFLDRVISIQFIVPLSDEPLAGPLPEGQGMIDRHVNQVLTQLRLPMAESANRHELIRRLALDLTGRLPTPIEVRQFLAVEQAAAWPQLVDRLLESEEFVEYWTHRLAQLLRIQGRPQQSTPAEVYYRWLAQQVRADRGFDQWARELVMASGDISTEGPANFYRTVSGPRQQVELFSEVFMGVRMKCANCHDHPLDSWTQDDYHGLAAVFARIESGPVVRWRSSGLVVHPRDGQPARQRIPGAGFLNQPPETDSRIQLAKWLTSADNLHFARAMVNRIWKAMMGRGLVEPTDDLRATNPATHPELLQDLTSNFIASGYKLRKLVREIALSEAYQRGLGSAEQISPDDRFYSRRLQRPLSAEVLLDAICDVTGVAESFEGLNEPRRAIQLVTADVPSRVLDILGRCARDQSCEASGELLAGGLARRLHWLNGPLLNKRITAQDGRLHKLLAAGVEPQQVIEQFYQRCFSRPMNEREAGYWQQHLSRVTDQGGQRELLEDILWSLLSSPEFLMNH